MLHAQVSTLRFALHSMTLGNLVTPSFPLSLKESRDANNRRHFPMLLGVWRTKSRESASSENTKSGSRCSRDRRARILHLRSLFGSIPRPAEKIVEMLRVLMD